MGWYQIEQDVIAIQLFENHWEAGTWEDSWNDFYQYEQGIAEIKLAPNNTPSGLPTISGSLEIGETLTADISSINDADNFQGWTPTYSYSWKSSSDKNNWTEIGTDSSYVITSAEEGKYLGYTPIIC